MVKRQHLLCATALVGPLLCFNPATAQTAGGAQAGSGSALPEVVVVARRVQENIQKVPSSIGVISPQTLTNRTILSLNDVRLAIANMYVQSSPVAGGNEMSIRGVAGQSIPDATVFSSIGIYIDGVDMGRATASGDTIADLQQVEVLRGPQGTLFGRNASSGAINFITGAPTERASVDASVGLGNYDETRGSLTVNTGRFANAFTARMSYTHEGYGDDVKNVAPQNTWLFSQSENNFKNLTGFGGRDADAAMGKLRFDGLPGFTAEYKFDWSSQRDDLNGGQFIGYTPGALINLPPGFGGPLPSFGVNYANVAAGLGFTVPNPQAPSGVSVLGPAARVGPVGFNRLSAVNDSFAGPGIDKSSGHLLTLTQHVNDDITLKSMTAYRSVDSFVHNNQDGVSYTLFGATLLGLGSVSNQHQHQFSQEFQLLGSWQKFHYIVGLYYFREDAAYALTNFELFNGNQTVFPAPAVNVISYNGEDEKALNSSTAAYLHGDYAFNDQWDVTAGFRYTIDNQKAWNYDAAPGVQQETGVQYTRPNYDVTLTYSPDRNIHLYFRRATGYTSGGSINGSAYQPEDAVSDEVGVKSDLFDRRLRVNAAYFYSSYTNEQLVGFTNHLIVQNVGSSTIDGGELEISARPIDPLTMTANFGYNNPQYSASSRGGRNITPRTTINLSAEYKAWKFDNGAYVSIEGDGDYRSQYYAINDTNPLAEIAPAPGPNNINVLPAAITAGYANEQAYYNAVFAHGIEGGYWLGNARLSLADVPLAGGGKFRISAYVRNIANNAGKVYGVVAYSGLVATFERPRTYGVELAAHF